MDESKIQASRRQHDEESTSQRAAILGLQYMDTREVEDSIDLAKDILEIKEMYQGKLVPLVAGGGDQPYTFGVTTQTPQSLMQSMSRDYNDRGENIRFLLISQSAYKAFMNRFDPPKQVIYDDIKIAKEGDSDTLAEVSQTLNSVGTDRVFDFLIDQADKLGASDIHVENERDNIRIRMRVDGALHPVADLAKERYRVIMAALSSRANISTAANQPQSGHMQKEITRDGDVWSGRRHSSV